MGLDAQALSRSSAPFDLHACASHSPPFARGQAITVRSHRGNTQVPGRWCRPSRAIGARHRGSQFRSHGGSAAPLGRGGLYHQDRQDDRSSAARCHPLKIRLSHRGHVFSRSKSIPAGNGPQIKNRRMKCFGCLWASFTASASQRNISYARISSSQGRCETVIRLYNRPGVDQQRWGRNGVGGLLLQVAG